MNCTFANDQDNKPASGGREEPPVKEKPIVVITESLDPVNVEKRGK